MGPVTELQRDYMEEEEELRNPFPSPPSHYARYTDENLRLLSLLRERERNRIPSNSSQYEILVGELNIPDWSLKELEKPRVDWILEEGEYAVFGDLWWTKEHIPGLTELGGTQLYPEDSSIDRRPALLSILRTLLLSYSTLLKSMLLPPPSIHSQDSHDWNRHMHWITVMSQNITAAANDLRPAQARVSLETMIRNQLEVRRTESKAIQQKCDLLENMLLQLKESMAPISCLASGSMERNTERKSTFGPQSQLSDVLSWANTIS